MHSWGFSWPATNATVRLSLSCFSVHAPESLALSILRPSPSAEGPSPGMCFWLASTARRSSSLNRLTTWRARVRLGNGKRSRTGKFMKMGLKISRLTALWSTLMGAVAEVRACVAPPRQPPSALPFPQDWRGEIRLTYAKLRLQ